MNFSDETKQGRNNAIQETECVQIYLEQKFLLKLAQPLSFEITHKY